MRKSKLEIWLGMASLALLAAVAFGSYYRNDFRAWWLRRRFDASGDPRECALALFRLARLGPKGHRHLAEIIVPNPAELTVLSCGAGCMIVRNDRPHRVVIKAASSCSLDLSDMWEAKDWEKWAEKDVVFIYTGGVDMSKILYLRGTDPTKSHSSWDGTLLEPGGKAELLSSEAAWDAWEKLTAPPPPPPPKPRFGGTAVEAAPE